MPLPVYGRPRTLIKNSATAAAAAAACINKSTSICSLGTAVWSGTGQPDLLRLFSLHVSPMVAAMIACTVPTIAVCVMYVFGASDNIAE